MFCLKFYNILPGRAFTFGMETRPVMCQAVNTAMAKNCDWASCGEWCLTKTSGFCPQIQVTTRRNGTTITVENCTNLLNFSCPMVSKIKSETYLFSHFVHLNNAFIAYCQLYCLLYLLFIMKIIEDFCTMFVFNWIGTSFALFVRLIG